MSSVTRVFIQQKLKSIAVLKCVGAGTRQVIAVYVVQVLLLGLAGSLARRWRSGGGVGRRAGSRWAAAARRFRCRMRLTAGAMVQAFGDRRPGVAAVLARAAARACATCRPSLLLRQESPSAAGRRLGPNAGASHSWPPVVVAWPRGRRRRCASALIVCGRLPRGRGRAAVSTGRRARARRRVRSRSRASFAVRHAVLHLSRPGNQTRVVLLAVGLGVFFIFGDSRRAVESAARVLVRAGNDQLPDMFLIDVQEDQLAGVRALVSGHTGQTPRLIPVLRARVTQVRGKQTTLETVDAIRGQRLARPRDTRLPIDRRSRRTSA